MAETRIIGTVKRASLEGGLWILSTSDGATYQLRDAPGELCQDGLSVEVTGEIDTESVSIGMMGETLRVRSFRALAPRP